MHMAYGTISKVKTKQMDDDTILDLSVTDTKFRTLEGRLQILFRTFYTLLHKLHRLFNLVNGIGNILKTVGEVMGLKLKY